MKIDDLLKNPSEWVKADGPNSKIVMSSRVRLARNIRDHPFPGWAKKVERQKLLEMIQPVVEALPEMADHFGDSMDNISAIHKQVLVERHLISREHAAKNVGSGVVINDRETISVMVNEEDHLRMQTIKSGLQLKSIFKIIDQVDTELGGAPGICVFAEARVISRRARPMWAPAMRGSAMVHLPGMVLSDQINQVVQAVNKLGLAVRGLYGEGTEALGNVFQVSNQTTLGEKEMEVVERLNKVILQIIEHEENARITLLEKKPKLVYDQIGRAYGILTNAHTISSKEALNLLSLVRMGVDLEIFPATARVTVDEMFILSQPAHVQRAAARKLTAEERDILRAELIRTQLAAISKPDLSRPSPRATAGKPNQNERTVMEMNNFTPRAQQVLALARKEADRFNHNYVGTEHLLLGLIKLGQGVAVNVLQKMGLDLETVRMEVEKQIGTGPETKMVGQHSLHAPREKSPRAGAEGSQAAQPQLRRHRTHLARIAPRRRRRSGAHPEIAGRRYRTLPQRDSEGTRPELHPE